MSEFRHYDLEIVEPSFSSDLASSIVGLDHLRNQTLGRTTHPSFFSASHKDLKDKLTSQESVGLNSFLQRMCKVGSGEWRRLEKSFFVEI